MELKIHHLKMKCIVILTAKKYYPAEWKRGYNERYFNVSKKSDFNR